MYPRLLLLSLVVSGLSVVAQAPPPLSGIVEGQVVAENDQPVPYANVAFYTLDSQLVTGTVSDDQGAFSQKLKSGEYYATISFLSYKTTTTQAFEIRSSKKDLGKIILKSSDVTLDEFVVEERKSQMTFELDKRVFNVGSDLSNQGGSAADILNNVPSVEVDPEGSVSLRGSENVRILIDGKPSGLVGASSTEALRLLQGNMIESVEVITNPSAKYDAQGEAGIINIVLKKEKKNGLNGSFDFSTGVPHNHGIAYNLNWRRKKLNLFSSLGAFYRSSPGNGGSVDRYDSPDTSFRFERDRNHLRSDFSGTFRFGADYFISEKTTLTAAVLYKYGYGRNFTTLEYRDIDENGETVLYTKRKDDELELEQDIEGSLALEKKYDRKGHQWSTNLSWFKSDDTEDSDLDQFVEEVLSLEQQTNNVEDQWSVQFSSDYAQPFADKAKFETGVRMNLRQINNDFQVKILDDGVSTVLPQFDNNMVYTENVSAGYFILGNETGAWSYQGGLRLEYSEINTELTKTNEINKRQYLNLFPSGSISYKTDKGNNVQMSYSRRISRPGFRQLLPFFSFSDNRSFFSGNADLNPEFSHSIELGYLKYFQKGSLLSSIYYRHKTGAIQYITEVDSTGLIRRFPINLATEDAIGLEFSGNYDFTDAIGLSGSANFYRAVNRGEYEGQTLFAEAFTMQGRAALSYQLKKAVNAQVSFNYRAPAIVPQGRTLSRYSLDFGLSKEVMKGNGTLTLSGRDMLNTMRRRSVTETEFLTSESDFQWRVRQITLNFTYRLNQSKGRMQRGGSIDGGDFEM